MEPRPKRSHPDSPTGEPSPAHYAALLFNQANQEYFSSGALQAIHISLAYRRKPHSLSLKVLSSRLRADPQEMKNMKALIKNEHLRNNIEIPEGWEQRLPEIIKEVFWYANQLLAVDQEQLEPFFVRHTNLEEFYGLSENQRRTKEVQLRTELRALVSIMDEELP